MAEGQSPETSAEWEAAYHRVLRLLRTAEAEIKRLRARAGISEFHAYPSPQARRDVEWLLGEVDRQRRVCDLAAELCNSIDSWEEDIGGYRLPNEILKDLGPAVSELDNADRPPSPPPDGVEGLVEALVHDLVGELNTAFMTYETYDNNDYKVRIHCRDLQTTYAVYELILMLGMIVKKQPLPSWAQERANSALAAYRGRERLTTLPAAPSSTPSRSDR